MPYDLDTIKAYPLTEFVSRYGYTVRKAGSEYQLYSGDEPHRCFIDPKANVYKWHSRDHGGTIIDFIMNEEGLSLKGAIQMAKEYVRVTDTRLKPVSQTKAATIITKAPVRIKPGFVYKCVEQMTEEGLLYWEGRGITRATIAKQEIGMLHRFDRWWFTFPVRDADGVPLFFKLRICPWSAQEGDQKGRTHPTGHATFLWPLQGLLEGEEEVLLCEGETDTLSAISHGYNAICGTHGAGNWSRRHTKALLDAGITKIMLAYDNDDAGRKGREKVRKAVQGKLKVGDVVIPAEYKDLAEYLQATDA